MLALGLFATAYLVFFYDPEPKVRQLLSGHATEWAEIKKSVMIAAAVAVAGLGGGLLLLIQLGVGQFGTKPKDGG